MSSVLDRLRSLRVADVMSRSVVTVSAGDSMEEAAERIVGQGISGAPVVDEMGRCVGMLSALDFVRRQASGEACADAFAAVWRAVSRPSLSAAWEIQSPCDDCVASHMSPAVQCVKGTAPLTDAARIMSLSHVHRLPVLDEQARPVGMITALDVVSALVTAAEEASVRTDRPPQSDWERQITEEHAQLQRRIKDVRNVLAGRNSDENPAAALLRLCREAKQHFDHEEQTGYFARRTGLVPSSQSNGTSSVLRAQAEQLRAEHGEMQEKLRQLAEAARQGEKPAALRAQFETLARQWLRHEADENRLLLSAGDPGTGTEQD